MFQPRYIHAKVEVQSETADRFHAPDPELVWRLTARAIVGINLAFATRQVPPSVNEEIVVRSLCMTGIGIDAATELAVRPKPAPLISEPVAEPRRGRNVSMTSESGASGRTECPKRTFTAAATLPTVSNR